MWLLVNAFSPSTSLLLQKAPFNIRKLTFIVVQARWRLTVPDRLSQPNVDCFATLNLSSVPALYESILPR